MKSLSLVFLATILALPCFAKDDKQQQAEALFARAAQVQGIERPGSPPFQLRMSFQVILAQGPPIEGDYLLVWAAPDQWRSEVNFRNFHEVRFGGPSKMWWLRSTPSWPSILVLPNLQTIGDPKIYSDERVKKIRNVKRKGAGPMKCVLLERPSKLQRVMCFDPATGAVVGDEKADASLEYSDFAAFGDKTFPRTIKIRTPARNVALQVDALTVIPAPNAAMFQPPGDAQEWSVCDDMQPPTLLKGGAPRWPKGHYGEWADVLLTVVIETDGTASNAIVSQSSGRDFDAAALAAVQKWRFRPAMCGGTPVRQQIVVDVGFGR